MLKRLRDIKNPSKQLKIRRDRELILSFQKGDLKSFSKIYSKYYKPVLNLILTYIKSDHISEELAQDVFIKIYQFKDSYNQEYELSTWIWTITKNTVYDYLRRTRVNTLNLDSPSLTMEVSELALACTETAETIMIQESDRKKLLDLMTALSVKQKEAIILRLVNKFTYQEISKSMNLSLSAVKSLINRGKASLIKLQSEPNAPQNLQI